VERREALEPEAALGRAGRGDVHDHARNALNVNGCESGAERIDGGEDNVGMRAFLA